MSSTRPRQFTLIPEKSKGTFFSRWNQAQAALRSGHPLGIVATFLALLLTGAAAGLEAYNPGHAPVASEAMVQEPIATVVDIVDDLLDDLIDSLEDGALIATAHGTPLSSQEKQDLDADLDLAEALIDDVFNPAVEPNLTPVDAGSISLLFTPYTLADYAEQCVELAQQAKDELVLHGNYFDHNLVGTKLKTIQYLISRSSPHNYRTKAGIN